MNTTVHYIKTNIDFSNLKFRKKLVPGGIYIVTENEITPQATLYFAVSNSKCLTISGSGSGGSNIYSSPFQTIEKIGGLEKGSNVSVISYNDLFTKILYPNIDMEFPDKPLYLGFSEIYPTVEIIKNLENPSNYFEFDYKQYTSEGYIIIALPATWYLNKIQDSNGMNILGAFELIYKSISINNDLDIYNVYVTPKISYNSNLELTFKTETGTPVQTTLTGGIFELNNIKPVINSLLISEGLKAVVNSVGISIRFVESVLNNMSLTQDVVDATVNALIVNNANVEPVLNSINVTKGTKSILNEISIEIGGDVTLNTMTVFEGMKSILNNITITNL